MKIVIETILHETQRYTTVGDWFYAPDGTLHIKVSALSDPRYEFLVGIHEAIECELCRQAGVTQEVVDKFDIEYEKNRADDNEDEAGDDPAAPYHTQHCVATGVERILAAVLGVDWKLYEQELFDLPEVKHE
jgi:hypothetical protein